MMNTLYGLIKKIRLNEAFLSKVTQFRVEYLIKNSEFFSQPLTGTVNLYFKTVEVSHFFEEVCEVDELTFQKTLKGIPNINQNFKVTSDHFNILIMLLAHRAKSTAGKVGERLAKELLLIFSYRTLSALVSDRFSKYLAKEEEAYATYEKLSNKFILKKLKSWAAYCNYRADHMLDMKTPSGKRLTKPKGGDDFLTLISGLQTAIASTFNAIFSVHMNELENNNSVERKSSTTTEFGSDVTVDSSSGEFNKINDVMNILPYGDFINNDILDIVDRMMKNMSIPAFKKILSGLQKGAISKDSAYYESYIRDSLIWMIKYLRDNRTKYNDKDLHSTILYLRGGISASRTNDEALLSFREIGIDLVKNLSGKKDRQLVMALRNSLSVYLYLIYKIGT